MIKYFNTIYKNKNYEIEVHKDIRYRRITLRYKNEKFIVNAPLFSSNTLILKFVEEKKEKLIEDDGFWHGKYKCTEFHPASSHNKYKIWYEEFENAKRKGDWIILSNGVKKKFSNCIDVTYTKFKRRKKK